MSLNDDTALIGAFEAGTKEDVRNLARSYTRDAIKTLVKLMKAPKTPAGVKRQCATDILAQGWGRPDARNDTDGAAKKGITVNILKLSTGVMDSFEQTSPELAEAVEAMEIADFIESNVEKAP